MINTTNMSADDINAAVDFEANRADTVHDAEAERITADGGLVAADHAEMIRRLFRGHPDDIGGADVA